MPAQLYLNVKEVKTKIKKLSCIAELICVILKAIKYKYIYDRSKLIISSDIHASTSKFNTVVSFLCYQNIVANFKDRHHHIIKLEHIRSGLEVIKFEFILKLKIKQNDWLPADTSPHAVNQCALF